MSPRKTRRGAKAEGADETMDPADQSKIPDTPPDDGKRIVRTRRQLRTKVISDSDVEQSPQLNESKRTTRRGRGKKVAETADDSVVNTTTSSARKRTKKVQEVTLLIEDSVIEQSQIQEETVSAKKARGRGGKKVAVKKNPTDTDDAVSLPNENVIEDVASAQLQTVKTLNDDNLDGMSSEDNEVAAASRRGRKKATVTPTNPRFHQLRSRGVNSPGPLVTPECSPLVVDLTPHRTTKTPRKSPVDLGSPKTHSTSSQRHSKTPRKLPIIAESPVPSETASSNGTPSKATSTETVKLTKKSPRIKTTGRSSKSPRIVVLSKSSRVTAKKIRKSQGKSPKSPHKQSPKESATPQTQKMQIVIKSPQVLLQRVSPMKISPKTNDDMVTPILSPSLLKKLNDQQASPKRQKSTGKKRSPITSSGTPLRPIATPVHSNATEASADTSNIISSNNTPLALLAAKNKIAMTSSTPRERIRRSLNLSPSLEKLENLNEATEFSNSPVSVEKFYGRSPRTSTRIHDASKISRLEDETNPLISDDESFDVSGIKAVEITEDDEQKIVDDVKTVKTPEKEGDKANGTYELAEPRTPGLRQKKAENDTYELDEPKTPGLRKKRQFNDTGLNATADPLSETIAPKRIQRVRFASPPMRASVSKITMRVPAQVRSATPASKSTASKPSGSILNRSLSAKSPKSMVKGVRRRSNSLTLHEKTPSSLSSGIKKRLLSVVDAGSRSAQKTHQNESVNRLSRPRQSMNSEQKPELKPLSAKKVPNFAQIHQKKFAQMESLVDSKKRVQERHNALTNSVTKAASTVASTSTTKVAPKIATNGAFNRFGFKVRKEEAEVKNEVDNEPTRKPLVKVRRIEATRMVNKQPAGKKIETKKVEQRMALQGVRSNRRFELQMKMRNLNS